MSLETVARDNRRGAVGLRMVRGQGYLRGRIAGALWRFERGDAWVPVAVDLGLGAPLRVARWDGRDVWAHRYTYGERLAGYPTTALALGGDRDARYGRGPSIGGEASSTAT